MDWKPKLGALPLLERGARPCAGLNKELAARVAKGGFCGPLLHCSRAVGVAVGSAVRGRELGPVFRVSVRLLVAT